MPVCSSCEKMDATVNMRRRKPPYTGQWLCKDKDKCKQRTTDRKEAQRGQKGT